ncbi:hypothetical protein [Terasakiella pusilla]|uniref:ApeA N-terminal domain 1-containing protein n=1 Tax=Terasakiella pusilla TaxID=64973 RepID=UPI003AA9ACCB
MDENELPHNETYEWTGQFWFPDKEDEKLSGHLSYTPDSGFTFKLFTDLEPYTNPTHELSKSRKVMFGKALRGKSIETLSLFNVSLYPRSTSYVDEYATLRLDGYVDSIMLKGHLLPEQIQRLKIQYDDHYNFFYLSPSRKEEDMVNFAKGEKLTTNSNWHISLKAESMSKHIYRPEQLESMFWSREDTELNQLKEHLALYLEKNELFKRTSTNFVTVFASPNKSYQDFISFEHRWRAFFEFMEDQPISVQNAWISYNWTDQDGCTRLISKPLLSNRYTPRKQKSSPKHILHRKMSFYDFQKNNYNLSNLKNSFDKWHTLKTENHWQPVHEEIQRLMRPKEHFGETSAYVSLLASIETLLDLLLEKKKDVDVLINKYASDNWCARLKSKGHFPKGNSLGVDLKKIRNAITHPMGFKNCIYATIRSDPFLLQYYYIFLSALFLKATIEYLDIGNEALREKYSQSYINNRANIYPIEFS